MTPEDLGHYRLVEKLGEGGMGVVYKARDTNLDRTVALKILPPAKVADPERKRRFVQEAKAASALNHPNIVTIYEIGADQGRDYLAMEFVAGQTLDRVILPGGLKLDDALRFAGQIAQGLAAAHAAGITHRDLKPSNIIVTEAGQVKLLDFGLAKLTDKGDTSADDVTVTAEGTIVGTVAYMSPEQAEGKRVDARSDIFAFGALLYEMVTGRRAFRGETAASTLGAVIHKEPEPLGVAAPRELDRLIRRCLRKDRTKRYQHMGDVAIALEEIGEAAPAPVTELERPASTRSAAMGWVAAGLVTLLAGGWFWWNRAPAPAALLAPKLTRLTFDPGLTTDPALWAPGNLVAYASDRAGGNLDIWIQQLSGGEPRRLTTHLADDHEPSFSPDGSQIVFRSGRDGGGIFVIPALGGTERKVAGDGNEPKFSPDGRLIAFWRGTRSFGLGTSSALRLVPARGGAEKEILPGAYMRRFVWAPDSQRILFQGSVQLGTRLVVDWFEAPLDGGPARPLGIPAELARLGLTTPIPLAWGAEGVTLAAAQGDVVNLWRLRPGDPASLRQLTFGGSLDLAASVSGDKIVFAQLMENPDVWALPADPNAAKVTGELTRLTHSLGADVHPTISQDGRIVAFNAIRSGGSLEVMALDTTTGREWPLASSAAFPRNSLMPLLARDGRTVAYNILKPGGRPEGYVVPVAGGMVRQVCNDCQPRDWAADHTRLVVTTRTDTALFDWNSGTETPFYAGPSTGAKMSPDGRWMAFYIRTGLRIVPVGSGVAQEKDAIAITQGETIDLLPEFSPDGRTLYFFSDRDGARCLWAQTLDPLTQRPQGAPRAFYHFHRARVSPLYNRGGQNTLSAARDRFVFVLTERLGNLWLAEYPPQK